MKITSQQLFLLLSLVFLIFFCGTFYFLYSQIKKNNTLAEDTNIKWREEERGKEDALSLERELRLTAGQRQELEAHFAKNSDLVPFLDTIEDLAKRAGTKASTTSVDLSADGQSLLVGLRAEGSFAGVYKLLALLENSPYELQILSVDMYRESPLLPDPSPLWQARFIIKLLSFTN